MYKQPEKQRGSRNRTTASHVSQKKANVSQCIGFIDNRPLAMVQRKTQNSFQSNQVMQLKRVAVMFDNFTVIGFDTEKLTKDVIQRMIDNPGVALHSKKELQQALDQGDYLGGSSVHQINASSSVTEQPQSFSGNSSLMGRSQPEFGMGGIFGQHPSTPIFSHSSDKNETKSTGILETSSIFGEAKMPFDFSFGEKQQIANKNAIVKLGLQEASRKLNLVKEKESGFDKIDTFIQFVSDPGLFSITGERSGDIIALAKMMWGKVQIFEAFFDDAISNEKRADTLIHEMSHIIYQSHDYSYKWNRVFKYLTEEEHRHNPDSVVTLINKIIQKPSGETPPETTAAENVPEKARTQADKAFAIIGDILYHTRLPKTEQLKESILQYLKTESDIKPEYYGDYSKHISAIILNLDFYKSYFRGRNVFLIVGERWSVREENGMVVITLSKTEEKYLEYSASGGGEKVLVWLAFQITNNIVASKVAVKIILNMFNAQGGKNIGHSQGMFPSVIKLNSDNV